METNDQIPLEKSPGKSSSHQAPNEQDKGSLWNASKGGTASLTPGSSDCFQTLRAWPSSGSTDTASATPSLPHSRLCQLKSKHAQEGKRLQKSSVSWFKLAKIFAGCRCYVTSILLTEEFYSRSATRRLLLFKLLCLQVP